MSRLAKNCAQNRCIRSFTHQATCHQRSAQRTVRTAARELGILIAADLLEYVGIVLGLFGIVGYQHSLLELEIPDRTGRRAVKLVTIAPHPNMQWDIV